MTDTRPDPDMTAADPRPEAEDEGRRQAAADDEGWRQAAARIRREHPGFVVIWVARLGKFRAWPLIRAPRGTVLTAETPDEMAAQMAGLEQAAQARRAGQGHADAAS